MESTRNLAFEGSFGTALPILINSLPFFEFVQTVERSERMVITRNNFFMLVNALPDFAFIYRLMLEISFIFAQERIYGFQGLDGLEKLHWVIQYNPALMTRFPIKWQPHFQAFRLQH